MDTDITIDMAILHLRSVLRAQGRGAKLDDTEVAGLRAAKDAIQTIIHMEENRRERDRHQKVFDI